MLIVNLVWSGSKFRPNPRFVPLATRSGAWRSGTIKLDVPLQRHGMIEHRAYLALKRPRRILGHRLNFGCCGGSGRGAKLGFYM